MSGALDGLVQAGRGGLYVNIHARPGAKRARLAGLHGDALRIAVAEPAESGKANRAIERFIAAGLDVPARDVAVVSGMTGRRKRVHVKGDALDLRRRLTAWLVSSGFPSDA
ncbi:MAG: DUF167 domain-containing protein [Mariprofundaceae bacterium]